MSDELDKSKSDVAYALVKAAIAGVPLAGGSAAEIFSLIVAPPIEKRRDRWLREVTTAVEDIRSKVANLTPEKLSQNPAFVTTLLQATQIAIRTHQEEKIEALRNALVNSAIGTPTSDDVRAIYLNLIDTWRETPQKISTAAL